MTAETGTSQMIDRGDKMAELKKHQVEVLQSVRV